MRFHTLPIAETRQETSDALYVEFAVPAALQGSFSFTAGQYLTLQGAPGGVETRRSYSICAAPGEPLAVAIKRIDGGVFSNFANDTFRSGGEVAVAPPAGEFLFTPEADAERHYLCIAAGSGITPIVSIIAAMLAGEPNSRVTLIYGNRRTSTMMFRDRLCWLKSAHLERFQWINLFTQEEQAAEMLNGRIDNRKGAELNRRLIKIRSYDEFYLCGPEGMISEVSRGLRHEGIDESRIHYELFFASAEDAKTVVAKHHARAAAHGGKVNEVRVRAGGREQSFELTADGENLLDAALRHGVDLPFSCKGGVCATCKARVVEGEVEMDLDHALTAAQREQGWVLTCQAHPLSARVFVDFDAG